MHALCGQLLLHERFAECVRCGLVEQSRQLVIVVPNVSGRIRVRCRAVGAAAAMCERIHIGDGRDRVHDLSNRFDVPIDESAERGVRIRIVLIINWYGHVHRMSGRIIMF